MSVFSGIWVPLVTPFTQGNIDFPALHALCQKLNTAGVDGVVVCATTGEAPMLSDEEQLQVLDAVLQLIPANKIMMGLSGTHLTPMLKMLDNIAKRNIAALLVPAPYYVRPSQSALIDWFTGIADHSPLPIVLYNIPYRTGVNLDLATLRQLAKHPQIQAIKDCGGSNDLTMSLISDGQLDVLCGEDNQIFSTLCLGGSGAIAASAHLQPEKFVVLIHQIRDQQLVAARQTFAQLLPMIRLMFSAPNPAAIKYALSLDGIIRNELRAPLNCVDDTTAQTIRQFFAPTCY
jgi:4-hydroxy-tetrahydrodipicolinate synthase